MLSCCALTRFLVWSSLVNLGVLCLWFLCFSRRREMMYSLHSRWFRISREQFAALHYGGMMAYKLLILLFNIAPLVALLIMRGAGDCI